MAEKEREENLAKVIEFPKEVRVYGNISHVYFKGKDKMTTLMVDQNNAASARAQPKKEKSTKEPILIVPIKQNNSELHFVKVPLQKLSKFPKAEKLDDSSCPKVSMYSDGPKRERLTEYKTNVQEIWKSQSFQKTGTTFDTCFVFEQDDPFQKNSFTGADMLPIADLFRFQEKPKVEKIKEKIIKEEIIKEELIKKETIANDPQPVLKKKPSVREVETNTDENKRMMKFLVSQTKRKTESK